MAQRLVLVGGGPGAVLSTRAHFHAAIDGLGRPDPLVAYVGVASDDNPGFRAMIEASFALTGARFRPALLASPRASVSAACDLLDACDLVFVSGGDVDHGIQVLRDRGAFDHMRALAARGKPMFGISAGSVMLGREWVRFPGDDDARAELFECLGAVPFSVDAHSEGDDWAELRTLVSLQHKRGDRDPLGYGLTSRGAIVVHVDDGAATVEALGTDIPRIVMSGGEAGYGVPLLRAEAGASARRDPTKG